MNTSALAVGTPTYHIKRSSTRLHAPPGGVSSLSFGPGGFGTVDPVTDGVTSDPNPTKNQQHHQLPQQQPQFMGYQSYQMQMQSMPPATATSMRSGAFSSSNNNIDVYSLPASNTSSTRDLGTAPTPFHDPLNAPLSRQGPATCSGPAAPSPGYNSFLATRRPLTNTHNGNSPLTWNETGAQPPLTSSKRDQNWERKRRQWLARKQQQQVSVGGNQPVPPTPTVMHVYNSELPSAHYSLACGQSFGAASPLSKLVFQQQQQFQQRLPTGSERCEYERSVIATPGPSGFQKLAPSTASITRANNNNQQVRNTNNQFIQETLLYNNNMQPAALPITQFPSVAGMASSNSSSYAVPPGTATQSMQMQMTAASGASGGLNGGVSSRTATAARQPPGGHSNWTPYGGY